MLDYSDYQVLEMKEGDIVFWDTLNKRYEIDVNDDVTDRQGIFMGIIPANVHPFEAIPWLQNHAMRRLRMTMYTESGGVSPQDRALIKVPQFSESDGSELLPFFYAAIPCTIYRVIDPETGETREQPRMKERKRKHSNKMHAKNIKKRKLKRREKVIPLDKIGISSEL